MLSYHAGYGIGSKVSDVNLTLDLIEMALDALSPDDEVDISDYYRCIGARALKILAPDAERTSFGVDAGTVSYADNLHIRIYGDNEVQGYINSLLDIATERDGEDDPEAIFTVTELRDHLAAWR